MFAELLEANRDQLVRSAEPDAAASAWRLNDMRDSRRFSRSRLQRSSLAVRQLRILLLRTLA